MLVHEIGLSGKFTTIRLGYSEIVSAWIISPFGVGAFEDFSRFPSAVDSPAFIESLEGIMMGGVLCGPFSSGEISIWSMVFRSRLESVQLNKVVPIVIKSTSKNDFRNGICLKINCCVMVTTVKSS